MIKTLLGLRLVWALGVAGVLAMSPAHAADKVRMTAVSLTPTMPAAIAVDRGYFRAEGLDVDLTLLQSASDAVIAVPANSSDVATASASIEVFNLAAQGAIKIVASYGSEMPDTKFHALIVSKKAWDAGIRTFADLKGKRIGLSSAGNTLHYIFGSLALKHGIDIKEFNLAFLQNSANAATALRGGAVDAAVLPPPYVDQLEKSGSGHVIAWARDELPGTIVGLLIASPKFAKDTELMTRFIRAYSRACQDYYLAFNQTDAQGNAIKGPGYDDLLSLIAKRLGVKAEDLNVFPRCTPSMTIDMAEITRQVRFWQSQGVVSRAAVPSDMVSLIPLK